MKKIAIIACAGALAFALASPIAYASGAPITSASLDVCSKTCRLARLATDVANTGRNYIDADGDGLCDNAESGSGDVNGSGSAAANGICDGTGKGAGRGYGNGDGTCDGSGRCDGTGAHFGAPGAAGATERGGQRGACASSTRSGR